MTSGTQKTCSGERSQTQGVKTRPLRLLDQRKGSTSILADLDIHHFMSWLPICRVRTASLSSPTRGEIHCRLDSCQRYTIVTALTQGFKPDENPTSKSHNLMIRNKNAQQAQNFQSVHFYFNFLAWHYFTT